MRSQLLAMTLLALVAGPPALAGEHDHGKADGKGHGRAWCPHCGEACYPTVTKGKETKHCFETENKPICIPKVRFPWEGSGLNLSFGRKHGKGKGKSGCGDCGAKDGCGGKDGCQATKCGRTKYVNVLLKHEYECTVCKYSWDPSEVKSGSKNDGKYGDGKYLDAPEPAAGEPTVPPPSAVEANFSPNPEYQRPVTSEPGSPVAERTGVKSFFSSFFK